MVGSGTPRANSSKLKLALWGQDRRNPFEIQGVNAKRVHPGLLWVQAQTAAVEEDGRFEILAVSEAAYTAFD